MHGRAIVLCILLAGWVSAPPTAPTIARADCPSPFGSAHRTLAGSSIRSLVITDFGADGVPEIVVADAGNGVVGSGNVQIDRVAQDGSLVLLQKLTDATSPVCVVARDFDHDGNMDVFVLDHAGRILVYRGLAGGALSAPVASFAVQDPRSAVLEDVDGDGIDDLIVCDGHLQQIVVLRSVAVAGHWAGSFSFAGTYPVGDPRNLTLADLDGDGVADLVVTLTSQNRIAWLLGHPDGTFDQAQFAAVSAPWSAAVGDVDGDNRADILVSNSDSSSVTVLRGLGGGQFSVGQRLLTGSGPHELALADIDSDGLADLVTANTAGDVSVLRGNGGGSFASPQSFTAIPGCRVLTMGDLDHDGHPDLVAGSVTGYLGVLFACRSPLQPALVGSWSPQGQPVCTAPGDQLAAIGIPDGTGGAIIAWEDHGGATTEVAATHITMDGHIAPGWSPNGNRISPDAGSQHSEDMCSDGAGGAFLSWIDDRTFPSGLMLQHVLADGSLAPGWPADGLRVGSLGGGPAILAVGDAGSVWVAWWRTTQEIDAQKFTAAGTVAPGWPAAPVAAIQVGGSDGVGPPLIASDGAGGAFVVDVHRWPCVTFGCSGSTQLVSAHLAADGSAATVAIPQTAYATQLLSLHADGVGGAAMSWTDAFGNTLYGDLAGDVALVPGKPVSSDVQPAGYDRFLMGYTLPGLGQDVGFLKATQQPPPSWNVPTLVVYAPGDQSNVRLISDGSDGCWLAWSDGRNGGTDVYGTHLDGTNAPSTGWLQDGNPICTVAGGRTLRAILPGGPGAAIVVWQDQRGGNWDVYAQRVTLDRPVSVTVSDAQLDVASDHVRLRWWTESRAGTTVERRTRTTSWQPLANATPDGTGLVTYVDRDVQPGAELGYRLVLADGTRSAESWATIPGAVLSIEDVTFDADGRGLTATVDLASNAPATLSAIDVSGRLVAEESPGPMPPGSRAVHMASRQVMRPGVYWLRLRQDGRSVARRVVRIR